MRAAWWWIDRWRKSTAYTDMTAEEQGVYRNLLDELWLRDGLIPLDERALVKISGDPEAWPRVREKVLARFERTADGYRNSTHDEVARGSAVQAEKGRKRAAKAPREGGKFTSRKPAEHQPNHQPLDQPQAPAENQPPSPSPSPSPTDSLPASPQPPADRYGQPGEAEQARRDLYAGLKAATEATGQPGDELLAKASRTGTGAVIVNPEGIASVPWLRATAERLAHIAARATEARTTTRPRDTRLQDYGPTEGPKPGTAEWDADVAEKRAALEEAKQELDASRTRCDHDALARRPSRSGKARVCWVCKAEIQPASRAEAS